MGLESSRSVERSGLAGAAPGAGLAAQSPWKHELPSAQGRRFSNKSSGAFEPELILFSQIGY